jgi:hypothetical protein
MASSGLAGSKWCTKLSSVIKKVAVSLFKFGHSDLSNLPAGAIARAVTLSEIRREAELTSRLARDPEGFHIVQVLGLVVEKDCVGFVSPLMRCSLFTAIHGKNGEQGNAFSTAIGTGEVVSLELRDKLC